MIQIQNNIEVFKNQLPRKPFCSNDLSSGVSIRNKNKALEMMYIQANQPAIQTCLVFDLDEDNAFFKFEEVGLPVPHAITKNPTNGRCHYLYMLSAGVCKTANARIKPLEFASAVENGMAVKLQADLGYSGYITKNPLNSHWNPYWSGAELYDLNYLSEHVELISSKDLKSESYGLGRNVNLFEDLRIYAYRNVLKFKRNSNFERWHMDLERIAIGLNLAQNPKNGLPFSEIKATAKSVARWTWKNFTAENFSVIQSKRAKKSTKNFTPEELSIIQSIKAKKNTAPKKASALINFLEEL
ncbi:replication initiation protein [Escherichia coli]|nr:replication initiation protein [Escherichia coli]